MHVSMNIENGSLKIFLDQVFPHIHRSGCNRIALIIQTGGLPDQLEAGWNSLPRRLRRETACQDKQVLSLFFHPAAKRYGEIALALAEELREAWNTRFPKNPYLAGSYETILKGFASSLLRLRLRKSKHNRK